MAQQKEERLIGKFHSSIQPSLDDLANCEEIKSIRGMEAGGPSAIDPRRLGYAAETYEEGFLTVYSHTREASQRILIEIEQDAVERVKEKISEVNKRYFGKQIMREMERYRHHFSDESWNKLKKNWS